MIHIAVLFFHSIVCVALFTRDRIFLSIRWVVTGLNSYKSYRSSTFSEFQLRKMKTIKVTYHSLITMYYTGNDINDTLLHINMLAVNKANILTLSSLRHSPSYLSPFLKNCLFCNLINEHDVEGNNLLNMINEDANYINLYDNFSSK